MDQQHEEKPTHTVAIPGRRFAKRVLLIGWEGAQPATFRLLLEAGRLPHLSSLLAKGAALELAVPRPAFGKAAWTSLATGKRPHEHGVLHAHYPVGDGSDLQPIDRYSRKCNAFWNVLNRAGLHTHIVGWPVTHPAESLAGICVSDQFLSGFQGTPHTPKTAPTVQPPEIARILSERCTAPHQVEEVTLGQLLPQHVIGSREYSRLEARCREILAQTATFFRAIRWSLNARSWDFAACVFPGVRRCHELANWLSCLSPTATNLSESLVARCYEHHDLLLGQLLSQVNEETHVMVVSPAGAACMTTVHSIDLHTHTVPSAMSRNNGMAVLCGPGVRHKTEILSRSILDVAPTILSLFGVPHGGDMAGRPLEELFEEGLSRETIETWDPCPDDDARQAKQELEAYAEDTATAHDDVRDGTVQQLIELGYTDPIDEAATGTAMHCERTTTLNRAISLLDAGLVAQATVVLEQLTQLHPDWYQSRSLLAETYHRSGHRLAARQEIDRLTCRGYENPQLYLISAAIEFAERRYEHALEELACTRRGRVKAAGASFLEGNIHLRRLAFQQAETAFQEAIEFDGPTALSLNGLASVKLHMGEYEEAAVYALDALEKDMRLGKAHYHLAVALYFLNRPQEALQALSSWAALESYSAAPYVWMARIYRLLLRDLPQAEACVNRGKEVVRRRRQSHVQGRVDDT